MPPRFALSVLCSVAMLFGAIAIAQDSHQLPANYLSNAHPRLMAVPAHRHGNSGVSGNTNGIPGIDSLTNWNGSFKTPGFDGNGKPRTNWIYNMVGNPPQLGGTTYINAPVVPVAVELLNPDGSVFLTYDPKPYILPTLQSPLFENSSFSSSPIPTQITDAIMRAEFWNTMAPDWHTLLLGSLKTERTMQVPSGFYYYALKSNGDCCLYVLIDYDEFGNLLFPATSTDTTTPIGAAENAGDGKVSRNPPAEPGAFENVSRSKRLSGVANAAPNFSGHLRRWPITANRFICSKRWSSSSSWLRM
jgi:hypothetical protein